MSRGKSRDFRSVVFIVVFSHFSCTHEQISFNLIINLRQFYVKCNHRTKIFMQRPHKKDDVGTSSGIATFMISIESIHVKNDLGINWIFVRNPKNGEKIVGIFANLAGKIRAAFRKILKTSVRMVLTPFAIAGDIVDWIWTRKSDHEFVEDADPAAEIASIESETDPERDRRRRELEEALKPSIGRLMKLACAAINQGKSTRGLYGDVDDVERHRRQAYVETLSETERNAILRATDQAASRHFSESSFQLTGLKSYRDFDVKTAGEQKKAVREAIRTAGWSALDFYQDLIDQAVERDEIDEIDRPTLWSQAQTLAGDDVDDLDYAA